MPKLGCIIHYQFLNSAYKQLELQNNSYGLVPFFPGKNIFPVLSGGGTLRDIGIAGAYARCVDGDSYPVQSSLKIC